VTDYLISENPACKPSGSETMSETSPGEAILRLLSDPTRLFELEHKLGDKIREAGDVGVDLWTLGVGEKPHIKPLHFKVFHIRMSQFKALQVFNEKNPPQCPKRPEQKTIQPDLEIEAETNPLRRARLMLKRQAKLDSKE